ncbi:MAG: NlpC/P60 family protein [Rubrimonas sp.]|uniref:NlpC/P60 family protein n=1 Tax=Rubrimonas sp. TaxID=2036015 RepID=UPI002FDCA69B
MAEGAAFRAQALAEARSWIGTPFHHGASARGAGADCLGLIRGVWRALFGAEAEIPQPYAPGFADSDPSGRLREGLARHLDEIAIAQAAPGDVLLLRLRLGGPAQHVGVLGARGVGEGTLIHAFCGRGVTESPLGRPWRARIDAAFRFPERV